MRAPGHLRGLLPSLAFLAGLLVTSVAAGCSAGEEARPAPSTARPDPTASTPAPVGLPWQPRLVLTPAEIAEVRSHLQHGDEPWASAWAHFDARYVRPAMSEPAPLEVGPYRGGGDVHEAFRGLDIASRRARDLAIAYALRGDPAYGRRARDILMAWARDAQPTRPQHHRSIDIGQLQSWGAFSFAYAYDLTRGSGFYSTEDQALVRDYFRRFTSALAESLDEFRTDPIIGSGQRRPYEWSQALTFRFEDWIVGGTFSMAMECAMIALSIQTDDRQTLHRLLADEQNAVRVDRVLAHALDPDNDGDGQGTVPVPMVAVMLKYRPERGGTVDYMTYGARLATILSEITASVDARVAEGAEPLLERTWVYLTRFFGPSAELSPNPQDVVDDHACLPRFVPAYRLLGDERILDVIWSGDPTGYYEPQFLGPVTLTHLLAL